MVVAAIYSADAGDTATLFDPGGGARQPRSRRPRADVYRGPLRSCSRLGYRSREGLKGLDGGPWKTRSPNRNPPGSFAVAWRRRGARRSMAARPTESAVGAGHAHAALWSSAASPAFFVAAYAPRVAARPRRRPQALSSGVLPRYSDARDVRKEVPRRPRAPEAWSCSLFRPILRWRSPSSRPSTAKRQCSSSSSPMTGLIATSSPGVGPAPPAAFWPLSGRACRSLR